MDEIKNLRMHPNLIPSCRSSDGIIEVETAVMFGISSIGSILPAGNSGLKAEKLMLIYKKRC